MEAANVPPRITDEELAEALPAALERASLLEWRLEQVTLREKDLWLRLETERKAVAEGQQRVVELTARLQEVEASLAEARRGNAALTARLAGGDENAPPVAQRAHRDAVALARAWRREHHRAREQSQALIEARARLDVLEHAQVRFHSRLTDWQRQVAHGQHDVDLAEFIAELRAEIVRLSQVNAELREQLHIAQGTDTDPPLTSLAPPSAKAPSAPPLAKAPSAPPLAKVPSNVMSDTKTEIDRTRSETVTPMAAPIDSGESGRPLLSTSRYPEPISEPPSDPSDSGSEAPVDGLWSPNADVRRSTAAVLARKGGPEARSAVLAALPVAIDPVEMAHLLSHLARTGGLRDEINLKAYANHDDASVRAAAMDAAWAPEILAQGVRDTDPYVRRRALIRWIRLDPSGRAAGVTRAVRDPDPGVRRTACAALSGHTHEAAVMALLHAVDDPDASVRAAAVRALPVPLRHRLTDAIVAEPSRRRAALNGIRAERRSRATQERSLNAR